MRQGICESCGRTRPILARAKCSSCYSAWHRAEKGRRPSVYQITCQHCGESHEASIAGARFCSQACNAASKRANPQTVVTCERCGVTVLKVAKNARFCSDQCRRWHHAGRPTTTELCVWVRPLDTLTTTPHPKRWWRIIVNGRCHRCKTTFTALGTRPDMPPTYCSERCARAQGKDRRRAAKRNAYVDDVSPAAIFERDNWTCQICRRKVDRTKRVPHPKAPTLDHIIPLGGGGTHEPANAQCAHFLCNSIKGDRGTDQLRLIG